VCGACQQTAPAVILALQAAGGGGKDALYAGFLGTLRRLESKSLLHSRYRMALGASYVVPAELTLVLIRI
jgi:hypothetical protein